jgi:predicted kinase
MAKLIIMVGISGSGKSTKAKEISERTGALIINRDKLREMLFGYTESNIHNYYNLPDLYLKENQITSFQNYLVERALVKGNDVIIDNTNLKQSYINDFIKSFCKYKIEFELIESDLSEAIKRDKSRTRSVGEEVIKKQFNNLNILKKNFNFKPILPKEDSIFNDISKPSAFIFDIDGTLALKGDRSPYDYARVFEDKLNTSVAKCLDFIKLCNSYVIICSGREGTQQCKSETQRWLEANGIEYDWILMREEGDKRADYIVKEEMWRKICKQYYIEAMFDDRNQVVNHARKLGFSVFQVNEGDF